MSTDDYALLKKGYAKKMEDWEVLLGHHASIVINPWLSKVVKREQVWPTRTDAERKRKRDEEDAESSLNTLKMLKAGGFSYVKQKVGDKYVIVQVKDN